MTQEQNKIIYSISDDVTPDPQYLMKLVERKMPFGKYKGRRLIDLPETYLVWFSGKGFPKGELGDMLRSVYEIKLNGLEHIFTPLKSKQGNQ